MSDFPWQNNQANKTPNPPAPQTPPAQPSQPAQPDPQFKSENIGKWASRQENPFAAQNRKDAAKKRESNRKRQKVSPYVIITASVLAVAAAVAGLIILVITLTSNPLPDDITIGSEGATQVSDDAQKVFDDFIKKFYADKNNSANNNPNGDGNSGENGDGGNGDDEGGGNTNDIGSVENPSPEAIQGAIDAVNDYFANRGESADSDSQYIDLVLVEMAFYAGSGYPEDVIRAAEKITTDNMTNYQKNDYYGMLMNASFNVGDYEASEQYNMLLNEVPEA